MIKPTDRLSIARIPLERIQIKEFQHRYPERLTHYIELLKAHHDWYPGVLSVVPSNTHEGMFALLDGHHRFAAGLMTGRPDLLCLVIEEAEEVEEPEHATDKETQEAVGSTAPLDCE